MTENMRYCVTNLLDSASLVSVSTENIHYLKANLNNQRPGKPFKFTEFSGQIDIQSGSVSTVNFVGIFNHNFASTATVQFHTSATSSYASGASYTKQITVTSNNCFATFTDDVHQFHFVTVSGNAASIRIGELVVGNSVLLNMNYQWGYKETYMYKNINAETVFGQDWSYNLTDWLNFNISFDVRDTTKDQLIQWIQETKGKNTPFCFITYDKGVRYCRHDVDKFSVTRNMLDRTKMSFNIKEVPLGKDIT